MRIGLGIPPQNRPNQAATIDLTRTVSYNEFDNLNKQIIETEANWSRNYADHQWYCAHVWGGEAGHP